eukprot:COSAG01_NODE_1368_length_10555_cov_25.123757_8_plen_663_part_00
MTVLCMALPGAGRYSHLIGVELADLVDDVLRCFCSAVMPDAALERSPSGMRSFVQVGACSALASMFTDPPAQSHVLRVLGLSEDGGEGAAMMSLSPTLEVVLQTLQAALESYQGGHGMAVLCDAVATLAELIDGQCNTLQYDGPWDVGCWDSGALPSLLRSLIARTAHLMSGPLARRAGSIDIDMLLETIKAVMGAMRSACKEWIAEVWDLCFTSLLASDTAIEAITGVDGPGGGHTGDRGGEGDGDVGDDSDRRADDDGDSQSDEISAAARTLAAALDVCSSLLEDNPAGLAAAELQALVVRGDGLALRALLKILGPWSLAATSGSPASLARRSSQRSLEDVLTVFQCAGALSGEIAKACTVAAQWLDRLLSALLHAMHAFEGASLNNVLWAVQQIVQKRGSSLSALTVELVTSSLHRCLVYQHSTHGAFRHRRPVWFDTLLEAMDTVAEHCSVGRMLVERAASDQPPLTALTWGSLTCPGLAADVGPRGLLCTLLKHNGCIQRLTIQACAESQPRGADVDCSALLEVLPMCAVESVDAVEVWRAATVRSNNVRAVDDSTELGKFVGLARPLCAINALKRECRAALRPLQRLSLAALYIGLGQHVPMLGSGSLCLNSDTIVQVVAHLNNTLACPVDDEGVPRIELGSDFLWHVRDNEVAQV